MKNDKKIFFLTQMMTIADDTLNTIFKYCFNILNDKSFNKETIKAIYKLILLSNHNSTSNMISFKEKIKKYISSRELKNIEEEILLLTKKLGA